MIFLLMIQLTRAIGGKALQSSDVRALRAGKAA